MGTSFPARLSACLFLSLSWGVNKSTCVYVCVQELLFSQAAVKGPSPSMSFTSMVTVASTALLSQGGLAKHSVTSCTLYQNES